MSLSLNNQSVFEMAVEGLKAFGPAVGALSAMIAIYCAIRPPKVAGWIVKSSIGIDFEECGSSANPFEHVAVELIIKLAVSNRRRRMASIVDWTMSIKGDPRTHRPLPIPDSYIASYPGLDSSLKPTRYAESLVDIRTLTATPFKTATGWLRFAFIGDCGLKERIVITMVDGASRKHKIKGNLPFDPNFWVM